MFEVYMYPHASFIGLTTSYHRSANRKILYGPWRYISATTSDTESVKHSIATPSKLKFASWWTVPTKSRSRFSGENLIESQDYHLTDSAGRWHSDLFKKLTDVSSSSENPSAQQVQLIAEKLTFKIINEGLIQSYSFRHHLNLNL